MKILIITNNDGGLYLFRRELIEQLLQNNQVFLSLPYGKYVDSLVDLGCVYLPTEFNRRGMNPLEDIKQYRAYKSLLKKIKPDAVLTYTIKPNVYGGMACARLGIPYLANVTGLGTSIMKPGIMQKLSLLLYRYGLRKAETVFFQNSYNLEFMRKYNIVSSNCVLLPGSGVNLENNPFETYPTDDSTIRFVTIGRIMKDKGTEILLDAAEIIKSRHNSVEFILIGGFDEDYQSKVYAAHEAGIINYVGIQNDVHSFIKNSHATIHPSFHEGLSNVLLETASSGRPILASNIPGCRETFDEGISGIGFESQNVDALVEAIEKFIHLPYEEKVQMGIKGRDKVEKQFDRKLVIAAYDKALTEIG